MPPVTGELLERVSRLCLALPETELTSDRFAHAFKVRRRVFVYLVSVEDPGGRQIEMLVCRADPQEREVLLAIGHPFFAPRSGQDRLGVILEDSTDWSEVGELVTESYRLLAPRKLVDMIDGGA